MGKMAPGQPALDPGSKSLHRGDTHTGKSNGHGKNEQSLVLSIGKLEPSIRAAPESGPLSLFVSSLLFQVSTFNRRRHPKKPHTPLLQGTPQTKPQSLSHENPAPAKSSSLATRILARKSLVPVICTRETGRKQMGSRLPPWTRELDCPRYLLLLV